MGTLNIESHERGGVDSGSPPHGLGAAGIVAGGPIRPSSGSPAGQRFLGQVPPTDEAGIDFLTHSKSEPVCAQGASGVQA